MFVVVMLTVILLYPLIIFITFHAYVCDTLNHSLVHRQALRDIIELLWSIVSVGFMGNIGQPTVAYLNHYRSMWDCVVIRMWLTILIHLYNICFLLFLLIIMNVILYLNIETVAYLQLTLIGLLSRCFLGASSCHYCLWIMFRYVYECIRFLIWLMDDCLENKVVPDKHHFVNGPCLICFQHLVWLCKHAPLS